VRIDRAITDKNRAELMRAVELAPLGAQFQLIDAPRTLAQNRMMWRLLTRIADQVEHCGEHWAPDDWKCGFLKAMGKTLRFMPALDGDGVVAIGYHSSKLSKTEMSEMIEMMFQYGDEHGVDFDEKRAA
jgi:NinB protein